MSHLNATWLHIIDLFVTMIAYAIFTLIFYLAVRKKGVGHRLALWMAVVFCGSRSLTAAMRAWDLYHGTEQLTLVTLTVSTSIMIVFALYCWHQLTNFVITLRRSEFGNKLEIDGRADVEQRRLNEAYVAVATRRESEAMLTWAIRREREHDVPHSSAAVGLSAR